MTPNTNDITLNVYITHWVQVVEKTYFRQIKSASIELAEHLIEHFRHVGIPRQSHPIQQQLWNLAAIGLPRIFVNIYCNADPQIDFQFFVDRAKSYGTELEFQIVISSPPDVSDSFSLTNLYKADFANDVFRADPSDLFMYLEHDQLFDRANLDYFLSWLPRLSEYGLLPGFLRIEWHSKRKAWVSTDQTESTIKDDVTHIQIDANVFIDLKSPYSGMYLVDLTHAKICLEQFEHTKQHEGDQWFRRQDIDVFFKSLGTAERSALGSRLAHHRSNDSQISDWFSSYPVGFVLEDKCPIQGACVWHASNNYAKQRRFRRSGYGTISLDAIYR